MKRIEALHRRIRALLTAPRTELGRWARFCRYQIQLWRFCARRLHEHNARAMSSALSFRTIFALIPVLLLGLLVTKSLGLRKYGEAGLRRLLSGGAFDQLVHVGGSETATAPTTVPASQPAAITVADIIAEQVARAQEKLTFGTVGPVGVVLLIWSALALLETMEGSLNRIFGAPRGRSLARRVLLYWSALTLGPVLLAATAYLSGQAASAFQGTPGLSWMLAAANRLGPAVVGIILLAALYKLMPNTPVRYRAAAAGALVAVPLWLLAKWALGLYVSHVVVRGSLYGALGLLPLFLLWLNVSWLIFLFGAELAATAANLERMASAERAESLLLGPWDLAAAALVVARAYARGAGAARLEEVATALNLPTPSVRRLLEKLRAAGIILRAEDNQAEAYVLGRPAETIGLGELLELSDHQRAQDGGAYHPSVAAALERARRQQHGALEGMTLAEVLASEEVGE